MKVIYVLIIIVLILLVPTIRSCKGGNLIRGGGKRIRGGGDIDNAINLYTKMQKITQVLTEEQIHQTHSTWGESFFFGLINTLFLEDKSNTFKSFPLYKDKEIILRVLKSITYWNKYEDETITAKSIYDIINDKRSIAQSEKDKIISLVDTDDIKSLQKRYPKTSKNDIIALIIRYGAPDYNPQLQDQIKLTSAYLSLPPPVYKYMADVLDNPVESFAGPINCTLPMYCSVFKEDKVFNSLGPFVPSVIKSNKNKTYICNPPYDRVSLAICARAIESGCNTDNRFTNILPAKDGGLFHMFGKRYLQKRNIYAHSRLNPNLKQKENQLMNESIEEMFNLDNFSGVLVLPRELMRYYNYSTLTTKAITYDSLMMFFFDGKTSEGFYDLLENIFWKLMIFDFDVILKWKQHHGFPEQVIQPEQLNIEIMERLPKNGKKIIECTNRLFKWINEFKAIVISGSKNDIKKKMKD